MVRCPLPVYNTCTQFLVYVKVHSDILIIWVASLVPFPLLNTLWSSPGTSSIFLSILLSILSLLYVWWWLHYVACGFFKAFTTSVAFLGCSPVAYMLLMNCVIFPRSSSPNSLHTSSVAFLLLILDSFFHFSLQNIRTFLVYIYFLFRFHFWVFWSVGSIV